MADGRLLTRERLAELRIHAHGPNWRECPACIALDYIDALLETLETERKRNRIQEDAIEKAAKTALDACLDQEDALRIKLSQAQSREQMFQTMLLSEIE